MGSNIEVALLKFIEKCGISYEDVRSQCQIIEKFPFTSSRKRNSVITMTSDGRKQLIVKGASELVLESCSQMHLFSTGIVVPLDASYKDQCYSAIDSMNKSSMRSIVLAYKDLSASEGN